MYCADVQKRLNAWCDGEVKGTERERGAVWYHRLTCAACRREWQRLQRLRSLTRHLPTPAPPPALKARLLAEIPASLPAPVAQRPQRNALKLAGLVAVFTLGLLLWPHSRTTTSLAAEVEQALKNVQTWHLQGWQIVQGVQVPWEYWGRRTPFFYREQLGDLITLDDGTHHLRLFPADATLGRTHPLVLKTPSAPDQSNRGWLLAAKAERWSRALKPIQETPTQAIFVFKENAGRGPQSLVETRYTVDKRTALPTLMEVIRSDTARNQPPQTTERLQIAYNTPLPETVTALTLPADAQMADTTVPPQGLPQENTVTKQGLSLQVTPIARDTQGRLLLRLRGWLGSLPLRPESGLELQAYLHWYANALPTCQDSNGQRYLQLMGLSAFDPGPEEGAERFILLLPMEPPQPQAPRPKHLTGTFVAMAVVRGKETGYTDWQKQTQVTWQHLTLTIPIPAQDTRQSLEAIARSTAKRPAYFAEVENLDTATAFQRADQYYFVSRQSKETAFLLQRAAFWYERGIATATTQQVQGRRLRLAEIGASQQKRSLARSLLRAILAEKRFPNGSPYEKQIRKQAEEGLRTWAKP